MPFLSRPVISLCGQEARCFFHGAFSWISKALVVPRLQEPLLSFGTLLLSAYKSPSSGFQESIVKDVPKFNKSPPLDRTLDLTDIPQAEVRQLLILLLPQPPNERGARQPLTQSVRREPVLRKAEIEECCYRYGRRAKLLLLFDEI